MTTSNPNPDYYIGIKQIQAKPGVYKDGVLGYEVTYPDGYISWSPTKAFENAYIHQGPAQTKVTQAMVDDFIATVAVQDLADGKTTLVKVVLTTGFVMYEPSTCVDASNYDRAIGEEICMTRVKNKIWEYLGFTLQWAKDGLLDPTYHVDT